MSGLRGSLESRGRWQGEVLVVHVYSDEVGRVWLCGAYIATMGGWDKDRATRVSSLANEEPLVVVEAGVDIVREIVGKDCGDSRDGVVREGETPLCRGGRGGVLEGAFSAEDRDVSRDRGISGHWGSGVFATRRGDEDIVGVDGDVLVKWSEEEGVENFLSDLGRSGRHGDWGWSEGTSLFYSVRRLGFLRGIFGWLS